jgi:hypothetical protein
MERCERHNQEREEVTGVCGGCLHEHEQAEQRVALLEGAVALSDRLVRHSAELRDALPEMGADLMVREESEELAVAARRMRLKLGGFVALVKHRGGARHGK